MRSHASRVPAQAGGTGIMGSAAAAVRPTMADMAVACFMAAVVLLSVLLLFQVGCVDGPSERAGWRGHGRLCVDGRGGWLQARNVEDGARYV